MIPERLAGTRILVTGVTGFVGEALLERLLADVPDANLVLLVRPSGGVSGRQRVEQLVQRPAFAGWRERVGAEEVAAALDRIEVIEGEIGPDTIALPGDLDTVIHCAATVSFDPPIDDAFATNLLGTIGLYTSVHASGSRAHLVHVSTAYVAGLTKGLIPEAPLQHQADWRSEAEAAAATRRSVESASRRPDSLERFTRQARGAHNRAGPRAVAADAERRRRDWVHKQLVEHGRARARSLGWPDVYTFTKALGERAAEEHAGDLPLSIVRPSIVESALAHPYPGWIEGFKMAEPIILAYGRGALPEFPAIPDGVLDIIPVDLVVNALLTVAANPPDDGHAYYHVCSGSRNPLKFVDLYENVREYFQRYPLTARGRGEIPVPVWSFPGSVRVERMLRTGERLVDAADRAVERLPRSRRLRSAAKRLDRERGRLEFVRRYADLYGAYTEIETVYTDEHMLGLFRSLPEQDRERFNVDPAVIDWSYYLQDVHCPSVTAGLRGPRSERTRGTHVELPRASGVLAVFDMDGTIIGSNVIESYLWLRLADLSAGQQLAELADVARQLPRYLAAERADRGSFLRAFYRRYEGASVEELYRLVEDDVAETILQRLLPAAVRRIREHRSAGHRTVLITGALDVLVEPLRPLFDEVIAAELTVRDGRYTGYLDRPPLVGEARAAWLRQYAQRVGADLGASYAYADSHSDLPLLEVVGNPVAVNPDVALYRVARRRRWDIAEWRTSAHAPVPVGAEA